MLWHGSVETIPSGWHLCDGTMGTPDLRAKFVYGAAVSAQVGTTFGTVNHTHNFTGDGHKHTIVEGTDVPRAGDMIHLGTTTDPAVGTTDLASHMPPARYLCYIMKL